jgi:hypothetical protein
MAVTVLVFNLRISIAVRPGVAPRTSGSHENPIYLVESDDDR